MRLNTITKLLDIPNYEVVTVRNHPDSSYEFTLDIKLPQAPVCSGCGQVHNTPVHSTGMVVIEDLPISGKRVFLHIPKRKCVCMEDGRIRVEELEWIKGRFTSRFAEQVYRLTSITTNKDAGWYLGLDDEVVYRIDRKRLEELAFERLKTPPPPRYISVDEVAWQKWHKYVTNVVDIETRKVIWNEDGRGKSTLDSFFKDLGEENCARIEAAASDGASGFISSIRENAKNAIIVLDHFHVKKYLNDAVDTVRKEELRKARKTENAELAEVLHCNKRFILMQNKTSKKREDILERLAGLNEQVYKAMLLKDQFLSVYKSDDRRTAQTNLKQWIVAAIKSGVSAFVELGYKFFRKRHFVLNYFVHKITSAISEGINNKIKRLKRMAYGYKDVKYFLLKIHQHCGLLNPKLAT